MTSSEDVDFSNLRVAFIGAGKMGQAMSQGLIDSGLMKAEQLSASDTVPACLDAMRSLGVTAKSSNPELVKNADVVVIAVKPDVVPKILSEVAPVVQSQHLFVSIAAGITLDTMETLLPGGTRCVRVMPNTPALVRTGASAFCVGRACRARDASLVKSLMGSVGLCRQVAKEAQLDAITGMSGSGPAYMFVAIEALADGGVKMGLPRDLALEFAAQTLAGSARLLLNSGRHPGQLKDDVCSPGGTSIAGVHELEQRGFRAAIISAVEAATKRSRELGQ